MVFVHLLLFDLKTKLRTNNSVRPERDRRYVHFMNKERREIFVTIDENKNIPSFAPINKTHNTME